MELTELKAMTNEWQALAISGRKDEAAQEAMHRLIKLANATGEEWEQLVRSYLAERAVQRRT